MLDHIQQRLAQGPCLDALDVGHPVLLEDVSTDTNWPAYSRAPTAKGCHSAFGVPMDLGETSEARKEMTGCGIGNLRCCSHKGPEPVHADLPAGCPAPGSW